MLQILAYSAHINKLVCNYHTTLITLRSQWLHLVKDDFMTFQKLLYGFVINSLKQLKKVHLAKLFDQIILYIHRSHKEWNDSTPQQTNPTEAHRHKPIKRASKCCKNVEWLRWIQKISYDALFGRPEAEKHPKTSYMDAFRGRSALEQNHRKAQKHPKKELKTTNPGGQRASGRTK